MSVMRRAAGIVLSAIFLCLTGAHTVSSQQIGARSYKAIDGRRVVISQRGNVFEIEDPPGFIQLGGKRHRDGYALGYLNPKTGLNAMRYDVGDKFSTNKRGLRDFRLISFVAPPSATNIPLGREIVAVSTLETRDGLLRLTIRTSWIAGTGRIRKSMLITNLFSGPMRINIFKNVADFDPDSAGHFSGAKPEDSGVVLPVLAPSSPLPGEVADVVARLIMGRCDCPPPPPPPRIDELSASVHAVVVSSDPSTLATAVDAQNDSILTSPSPGPFFQGRLLGDTQLVVSSLINVVLPRHGTRLFPIVYDID